MKVDRHQWVIYLNFYNIFLFVRLFIHLIQSLTHDKSLIMMNLSIYLIIHRESTMAARESQASREIVTPLYGTFPCVSCPPVDYRKVTRKPPVFDTAANLRNHCRRFHDPSYCSVCWASFPGYDGLNKHRKLGCEPSVRVRNGAKVNKDGNGRRSESTGSSSSSEDEGNSNLSIYQSIIESRAVTKSSISHF